MQKCILIVWLLSFPVWAQNAPATVKNPYPNYWCGTLPQHIRHSPVAVPCPGNSTIQSPQNPQNSPNDPPLDVQKRVTELSK